MTQSTFPRVLKNPSFLIDRATGQPVDDSTQFSKDTHGQAAQVKPRVGEVSSYMAVVIKEGVFVAICGEAIHGNRFYWFGRTDEDKKLTHKGGYRYKSPEELVRMLTNWFKDREDDLATPTEALMQQKFELVSAHLAQNNYTPDYITSSL